MHLAIPAWVADFGSWHFDPNTYAWAVYPMAGDWTFTAADLVIAGSPIKPRSGDRIKEKLNGEPIEFEVLPIGKLPCSEWLDTSGVLLLVHTKKVG